MHGRIMKKHEFIARMLAVQELRKERKKRARLLKSDYYGGVIYKAEANALREKKRGR
jgi:hypothetical protein